MARGTSVIVAEARYSTWLPLHRWQPGAAVTTIEFQNHGGLGILYRDVKFQKKVLDLDVSTFEYMCGHGSTRDGQFVLLGVYRPGSQAVSSAFFKEITTMFERLSVYSCPVVICPDFNVHVDDAVPIFCSYSATSSMSQRPCTLLDSTLSSPEPTLTSLIWMLAALSRTMRSSILRFVYGDRSTRCNQSLVEPGRDTSMCLHVTWLLHSCAQTLRSSATSRRTTLLCCTVMWWHSCLTSTVLWSWCVADRGQLRHGSTLSAATLVVKPEQPRDALGAKVLMRTSWKPCVTFMKPNVAGAPRSRQTVATHRSCGMHYMEYRSTGWSNNRGDW